MAYADLTTEQQNSLQSWLRNIVRPWAGEQARTNNHGAVADTEYNATITTILGELLDGDVIPVDSGLDGAESLTKAEVVSIVSHIQNIQTNYNTSGHRQLWAAAPAVTYKSQVFMVC